MPSLNMIDDRLLHALAALRTPRRICKGTLSSDGVKARAADAEKWRGAPRKRGLRGGAALLH
jgi:hypothetical protein